MPERIDKAAKKAEIPNIKNPDQVTPSDLIEVSRFIQGKVDINKTKPAAKSEDASPTEENN